MSTSLLIDKTYSDQEFIEVMRGLIAETITTNTFYEEAVKRKGFQVEDLNTIEDLELIPYIPTPFFKESSNFYKNLLKIPLDSPQFLYWNVSSCTSGDPSLVGISVEDREILEQLAKKCLLEFIPRSEADWENTLSLIFSPSLKFLNRIAQRYTKVRPARLYSSNLSEISIKLTKVKFLIKFFILKALWAILIKRSIRGAFGIDSKFVFKTIDMNMEKPEEERQYISLGGSAQLVSKFIDIMKERDISYNLGNKCDVITGGGGWDGHKAQLKYDPIDKADFVENIVEALGTKPDRVVDIYGFTESPIIFGSHWSKKHEDFVMHAPSNARIIVRDRDQLEPVKVGERGYLEVVTPFGVAGSVNHAVLIDDQVELISLRECPECGYQGATFKVLGRIKDWAGLGCSSIVTWL